jgi:undecaprenyl-diphosphatase
MTLLHALLLGILQGLTEFIPVSSTAHLLIAQTLFGLPADSAMFSYLVIIQLGTLVSLFIYYWQDLVGIAASTSAFVLSCLQRSAFPDSQKPQAFLGLYVLLATLPALLIGYLLRDAVEALFSQPILQAGIRLLAAAILLSLAETLSRKNRSLISMTWLDALVVGLFQVIAVFPGASRSGTTISGGMLRGFDRPSAARFAFLMSVPVLLAAGAYELIDLLQTPGLAGLLPLLAVGFISAALFGWLAIRWLIEFLSKRSLAVFAVYCAVLGLACLSAHFIL